MLRNIDVVRGEWCACSLPNAVNALKLIKIISVCVQDQ